MHMIFTAYIAALCNLWPSKAFIATLCPKKKISYSVALRERERESERVLPTNDISLSI